VLVDAEGNEVGRFGLIGHSRDLPWKVLESTERSLTHLLGESRIVASARSPVGEQPGEVTLDRIARQRYGCQEEIAVHSGV
jgi:hypothetical protein